MAKKPPIPKVVKLDVETTDRLYRLAEIKHRSAHWMMREAIARYITQEEHNEQLNQETLSRWQEAEQGKVVSHKAVSKWLDTWGAADDESKRPPCGK